jgi:hypothetical protein
MSERQYQTLKWAMLLSLVVGAAWGTLGCKSPTAPTHDHPNEVRITAYTQCYAKHFGLGRVEVTFWEHGRYVDCSADYGPGAQCPVAGTGMPNSRKVSYWGPWVRGEASHIPPELEWAAAHEVCHLTGLWDEKQTETCGRLVWTVAGCH